MSISEKQFKEEVSSILHEGFLQKQSRILKTWRRYVPPTLSRWCVITKNYLFTFKEQHKYESPTEVIHLPDILIIKKSDEVTHRQFSFTSEDCFFVVASCNSQREKWLGSIGAAMLKCKGKREQSN